MFILSDVLKSLINNEYLTANTTFQLFLNSDFHTINTKTLCTDDTYKWLLSAPINSVFIYFKNDAIKRRLIKFNDSIKYLISYDYIKDYVMPGSKGVKNRYTIRIVCEELSDLYLKSFLYKLNILEPPIFKILLEYGNTLMKKNSYKKAIDYIVETENTTVENAHFILEKHISSLCNFDIRIRKTEEPNEQPIYIIEKYFCQK